MESKSSKTSNKKDPGPDDVEVEQAARSSRGKRALVERQGFPKAKKTKSLKELYLQKLVEVGDMRKKQNEPDCNSGDDADDVKVEQAKRNSRGKRALPAIPGSSKTKKTESPMNPSLQKPGERTIQLKNHQEKWAKTNEDENTYDAAGSSGGPTGQSFPHNEEFQLKDFMAFCEMPVIKELWEAFSEAYTETSKGVEKFLDEHRKRELNGKWPERFKKLFEEGITEKFKATFLKYKEEDERQTREEYKQIVEQLEWQSYPNFCETTSLVHYVFSLSISITL
ncbi:hypothetical protein SLEP1_g207 [Rubroshorea leprosula]|uniref:Uncharacterized protein n=1 Tax=Rubroshorea leprosula TaxID=152421 RepID=A0AAV5HGD5_9ROSI|nr:hypothetical protein SLEP1_g207 [Rubroshorea leprosula]